jgi:tetratricopeptide (TPR) repeat protein
LRTLSIFAIAVAYIQAPAPSYNRRMRTGRAYLLCLGVALVLAAPAHADGKPDMAAAKAHYQAAKAAMTAKDYDTAVKEYIGAYEITKDPSLFKQIAIAYEDGGKNDEAVVYYRRYLAEYTKATDQADVKAKIDQLAPPPASEPTNPPNPATEPVVDPLGNPGNEPADSNNLPPPGGSNPPTFMDESPRWQKTAGWISVGIAAVMLTTGSVLGTSALSREQDLQRLTDFRDATTGEPKQFTGSVKSDYEDKVDEGKKLNTYATVAFIGAGVFAVSATVFFILDATAGKKAEKHASVRPSIYLGDRQAGIAAGWEF